MKPGSERERETDQSLSTTNIPQFSLSPGQVEILRQFRPPSHREDLWNLRVTSLPGMLKSPFVEHDKRVLWLHWTNITGRISEERHQIAKAVPEILQMVDRNEIHFDNPANGLDEELADLLPLLLNLSETTRDQILIVLGVRILHGLPIPMPKTDKE